MPEVIPLPRERIKNKLPVHLEVANLDAWENNRFRIRLDWNNEMSKWILKIRHLGTDTWVAHGPANLMVEYNLDPYITFILYDPSAEASDVTPENLGDSVKLGVFPKSEGDS